MLEITCDPGAETSGFTLSSRVGPWLEKIVILPPTKVPLGAILSELCAATVITDFVQAGSPTPYLLSPAFQVGSSFVNGSPQFPHHW